jgi:hypothetical protein
MEPVTSAALKTFLQRLGELYPNPAEFYLLGGSALCLLGNPRETLDPGSPEDNKILLENISC